VARYLLGTQCVVDLARGANLPPERWLKSLDPKQVVASDIRISVVTPMILTATFAAQEQTPFVAALKQACESLLRRFVLGKRMVPVSKEIADRWGTLLPFTLTYLNIDNQPADYDFRERLIMATAIEGVDGLPFTLVDRTQPGHTALKPIGLQLLDPYLTHP